MLKVLLADDEPGILAFLESILSTIKDISVVGQAQTVEEARQRFMETEPDIVFLDIQFPDGSGMDLARELVRLDPDIDLVFVTAHPGFTHEAFELYSYDYILKPIDENRVIRTIMQIKKERETQQEYYPLKQKATNDKNIILGVKKDSELLLINSKDILFIERVGKNVLIHTVNGTLKTNETLKNLENILAGQFFRSHKACLVNINKIEKIIFYSYNAYQIKFKKSDKEAFLSRRRAAGLFQLFAILS